MATRIKVKRILELLEKDLSANEIAKTYNIIFELVERREDVHPTIFCSQYSPSEWVTRMGASAKSKSIMDKFIYDSLLIGFNDFNMRNYLAKQNPKKWC